MNTIAAVENHQNGAQVSTFTGIKDKVEMLQKSFNQIQISKEDHNNSSLSLVQLQDSLNSLAKNIEEAEFEARNRVTKLENEVEKHKASKNLCDTKLRKLSSYLKEIENENQYLKSRIEIAQQKLYNKELFRGEVEKELNCIIGKLEQENQELRVQFCNNKREQNVKKLGNHRDFMERNGASTLFLDGGYIKHQNPFNGFKGDPEKRQKELEDSLNRLRRQLRLMHEENMSLFKTKSTTRQRFRLFSLPSNLKKWAEQRSMPCYPGVRTSPHLSKLSDGFIMQNSYSTDKKENQNKDKLYISKKDAKSYLYELDNGRANEPESNKKHENYQGEQDLLKLLNKGPNSLGWKSRTPELRNRRDKVIKKLQNRIQTQRSVILEEASEKIQQLDLKRRMSKEGQTTPRDNSNTQTSENKNSDTNSRDKDQKLEAKHTPRQISKVTSSSQQQRVEQNEMNKSKNTSGSETSTASKRSNQASRKKMINIDNFGLIYSLFLFTVFFFLKLGFSTLSIFSRATFSSGKKLSLA